MNMADSSGSVLFPDTETRLFCVFGDPVAQSKSPIMHNAAFAHTGYNGVYLAFRVPEIGPAMAAVRTLNIRGASVTIPHKVRVMEYLDEVDEAARSMGAVNTVVNENGRLVGKNTDGPGAVRALEEKAVVAGKAVTLLGSGGAARAIGHGLAARGCRVTVVHRPEDLEEAKKLAGELGSEPVPMGRVLDVPCEIVVNATPLGMAPLEDKTPVPAEFFRSGMVAMDAVYHPLETRFLREAKQKGLPTVNGAAMFIYQGALQFETWTGLEAPVTIMRKTVLAALGAKP